MNFPLQDFHFLRPEWFIALIPLLVMLLLIKRYRKSQSGWQSVIPPHLYDHLISGKAIAKKQASLSLLGWGWLLAVVALAGPTWERLPQPVFQVQQGNVVLIDMSLSMRATDVTPDRLTRAKYKAIDLINTIDEGEMGLVAYAGDAFTISPLTSDAANITALLPSLSPEIMPVPGSDPYSGIQAAAELLSNAGYQSGNIYWVTDGITLSQTQDLQDLINDLPFTVNVLGIGTEEGAPIRQLDGQLVKDQRGQIVIPKLRGQQLKAIANTSGGTYRKFTADESDIRALTQRQVLRADAEETDEQTSQDGDQWAELGPWLLIVLLPFAAYAFRRGVLIALLLTPMFLSAPQPAFAQSIPTVVNQDQQAASEPEVPATLWYEKPFLNRDQQGLKEYSAENYQTAEDTFQSALWKGSAAYNAGNYEEALKQFSQSDSTEALYNQGNALAQLGELDDAIQRYDEVLARDPAHADAKANKALLEEMKKQQEQQEQQERQDQQQQDDQEKNQDQQNQDGQDQQQNQDQQQDQQQQQNSQQDSSQQEQQNGQQDESEQDNQQQQDQQSNESEQGEPEQEQQQGEQPGDEQEQEGEQQAQQAQAQPAELTDEEKEKMQRLDNLMKRIPDDPAFLLKRKMQLEAQQRRRQGPPSNRSEW